MLKKITGGAAILAALLTGLVVAAPTATAAESAPVAVTAPAQPPPGGPPAPAPAPLQPIVTPQGLIVVVLPTTFPTFAACASGAEAMVNAAGFVGFSWYCSRGFAPYSVSVILGYV